MSSAYYPQIWQTVQQVPFGKVASYGQIADLAGLPGRARLVGKALSHKGETPLLPWHRVVRSDGSLAFRIGSAQALTQHQLLCAEGVLFSGHKVPAQYRWQPDLATLLFELSY